MARQKNMQRRRTILKNTFLLLREDGMDNVSLQMIADKSGISKSLLQSYYPHKNKLIIEIVSNFMTTILKALSQDELKNTSEYARMKVFIYLILEMGIMDDGISRVLESILKDNASLEKWGQLLDDWLKTEGVKDELGSNRQVQTGLTYIIAGGGSLYLKRYDLGLGAEQISDIMVKTFMSTFLDQPTTKVETALQEGHKVIENFRMEKIFDLVETMFDEKEQRKDQ
ncbi:TetR/AcrR family transcriptional regulator [uncultured Lactobacillus sp.]|uniref:TetR/AcrR family transcriptional regulator n=1 Tax=uncultured Lactobacillus sp. TaxID=153152 RepID=UPI00262A8904|nr:TetR/AcrR family transcriptional regulator [uncultured Lactobacillus sp.]